jgi:hypothetical protein
MRISGLGRQAATIVSRGGASQNQNGDRDPDSLPRNVLGSEFQDPSSK